MRLALAGETWCEIDEQEIRRHGVSYTIDTVRDYAARFASAQLFYLIGADNVPQLAKWREAGELARLVEFVVIPRPNEFGPTWSIGGLGIRLANGRCCCPRLFGHERCMDFPLGVSSSQIRARIKAGLPI